MFWLGCPSDASAWSCTTAGLCNIREQAFSTILSITSLFPLLFIHNHCLLLRVRSADNGLPKTSLLRHHRAERDMDYSRDQRHSLSLCQAAFLGRQHLPQQPIPASGKTTRDEMSCKYLQKHIHTHTLDCFAYL